MNALRAFPRKGFLLLAAAVFAVPFAFSAETTYEDAVAVYRESPARAVEYLEQLIAQDSGNPRLYLDLAVLHKQQGEYSAAAAVLRDMRTSCRGRSAVSDASFLLGELYFLQGDPRQALEAFAEVKEGDKYPAWIVSIYKGLTYESAGKDILAEKYYRASLKGRETSLALYRLAKLFYKKKKYKDAGEYFRRVVDHDSSIRAAYLYLGRCLFKTGDHEQAYNMLAKALTFFPEDRDCGKMLSQVKKKLGKAYFERKKGAVDRKRKEKELAAYTPQKGDIPEVKVGIITGAGQFTFKCGCDFVFRGTDTGIRAKKERFYTVKAGGSGRADIYTYKDGRKIAGLHLPVRIEPSGPSPFYLLDVSSGKGDFWQKDIDTVYKGALEVTGDGGGRVQVVNVLDLETYLYGVIAAEILPSSPPEALKAQAVAARTLAMKNRGRHRNQGYDFCNTTHCQVYRGQTVETAATTAAVDATRGEVMFFEGMPIEAFYHANCGGCLRDDIYGGQPFLFSGKRDLRGQEFPAGPWNEEQWLKRTDESYCFPGRRNNYRWQRVYDEEDFALVFGYPLEELQALVPQRKGDCGHIKELKVVSERGEQVIEKDVPVRDYLGNLKSSACVIEFRKKADGRRAAAPLVLIWGAGFGHGGGMCQEGAIRQAEEGFTYQDILKHYYKDIEIRKAY